MHIGIFGNDMMPTEIRTGIKKYVVLSHILRDLSITFGYSIRDALDKQNARHQDGIHEVKRIPYTSDSNVFDDTYFYV